MKRGIVVLFVISSFLTHAQSLKDALFSGKLKNQPGTTIRKGDDLSTKMDTARKVDTDQNQKINTTLVKADSSNVSLKNDSLSASSPAVNNEALSATNEVSTETVATTPKDNNVVWKKYVDSSTATLKTEVLSSKKIKKGTYYILVSYVIEPDGQVSIGDVSVSPDNGYLQQQIKDRLSIDTPHLNPVLSSTGTPRKVTKRYSFTVSKD